MAGYLGSKAVLLSTTAATVTGNATVGGSLTAGSATISGDLTVDTNTLYVDSANNRVGVRTTSPASDLHIENATSAGLRLIGSTTGANTIYLGDTDSGSAGYIQYNNNSDYMRFAAGGAERARIDASGRLLVGKTDESFAVQGAGIFNDGRGLFTVAGNYALYLNRLSSTGLIAGFAYNDAQVGSITVGSSSTSYNTSSDYRLKEDVQPMVGASERVLALNPVNFAWKATGTRVDGFLAHEAQEVVPEAVHGVKDGMREETYEVTPAVYEDVIIPAVDAVLDEEGNVITEAQPERTEQRLVSEAVMGTREVPDYQAIDQSKLVPLLTAALQEALNKIDDLEARVAALEAKQ